MELFRLFNIEYICRSSKMFFTIILIWIVYSCEDSNTYESKLPEIQIFPVEKMNYDRKTNCLIVFDDNGKICSRAAKIKYRGGYSSKFNKHSYRIELSKKYSPFGLPREDDWILNANYIDKTFMRHKLSFDLFRLMNKNNLAPRCKYVNLIVNHDYKGLYVLMQRINGKFCNIDKKDGLSFVFKEPLIFYENISDKSLKLNNKHNQKYPEFSDIDLTKTMDDFRNFLFNSSDSLFLSDIAKYIDINNVLDWHLLLLLSNNSDGLIKNFYLYRIDSLTPMRIAIWDYDHSFGRDGDNELNMLKYVIDCSKNVMLRRLMNIENSEYPAMLKKRWTQLRKSHVISTNTLKFMIIYNHIKIHDDIKKNFAKWPVNSKFYFDDNNYYQEILVILKFIETRITQLDKYFLGL